MSTQDWQFFRFSQFERALNHAAHGGVAVIDSGTSHEQYRRTAHIYAKDQRTLIRNAWSLGVSKKHIRMRTELEWPYFFLYGKPLIRAIGLVTNLDDAAIWLTGKPIRDADDADRFRAFTRGEFSVSHAGRLSEAHRRQAEREDRPVVDNGE